LIRELENNPINQDSQDCLASPEEGTTQTYAHRHLAFIVPGAFNAHLWDGRYRGRGDIHRRFSECEHKFSM